MTYFMEFFDLTTFLLTFLSREICPEIIAVSFFMVQSLCEMFEMLQEGKMSYGNMMANFARCMANVQMANVWQPGWRRRP